MRPSPTMSALGVEGCRAATGWWRGRASIPSSARFPGLSFTSESAEVARVHEHVGTLPVDGRRRRRRSRCCRARSCRRPLLDVAPIVEAVRLHHPWGPPDGGPAGLHPGRLMARRIFELLLRDVGPGLGSAVRLSAHSLVIRKWMDCWLSGELASRSCRLALQLLTACCRATGPSLARKLHHLKVHGGGGGEVGAPPRRSPTHAAAGRVRLRTTPRSRDRRRARPRSCPRPRCADSRSASRR